VTLHALARPVGVLAVGDAFMPAGLFTAALAGLGAAVAVTELQIAGSGAAPPRTRSERALREYVGDPAEVAGAVPGHEVLLVHGAPVTAEVLDSAPLRLVGCARGGPVNVDVAAAILNEKTAENANQAALAMAGRVGQLSLLNYLQ